MRQVRWVALAVAFVLLATLTGQAQAETDIEQVVFSVKDLERSTEVYTAVMGFRVRERGQGVSAALGRLWSLPPGTEMRWVLMEKAEAPDSIRIQLVQFTPLAPRARYEYREQDGGYLDVHLCVADVLSSYKELIAQGFTAMHHPILWRGRGGELGVGERAWYEAFMHGFDGEGITLIPWQERPGCKDLSTSLPFGPIRNITIAVGNLEEAHRFYTGVLDWGATEKRYDAFGPDMERMLRLPRGAVARAVHFGPPPIPWLTLVEFAGVPKTDLSARNAPPFRGLSVLSFAVYDIDNLFARMRAANVHIVMPPIEISERPYGRAKAFTVRGPDGVFMEFAETTRTQTGRRSSTRGER